MRRDEFPSRVGFGRTQFVPGDSLLLAGAVEGLPSGVYGFDPDSHELEFIVKGDRRARLYDATGGQVPLDVAPLFESVAALDAAGLSPRTAVFRRIFASDLAFANASSK